MAGDWIKMRNDLQTHPKVIRMASALKADRFRTIGGLHAVWCLFDVHSTDGSLAGYTPTVIDELVGFPGISLAMANVEWLIVSEHSSSLPEFSEHNGQSAKRRAQEATRKRLDRAAEVSASDADKKCTRGEERRGDKEEVSKDTLSPDAPAPVPPCPHQTLIDIFGQHLPTLPQPKPELWEGAKADAMRARWRWVMTAKRKSGERYATTADEAVQWFEKFFAYAAESDFLTGRSGKWTSCDLGWLMKAENFSKVVSGNYENKP